jgi:hypothetical protein
MGVHTLGVGTAGAGAAEVSGSFVRGVGEDGIVSEVFGSACSWVLIFEK